MRKLPLLGALLALSACVPQDAQVMKSRAPAPAESASMAFADTELAAPVMAAPSTGVGRYSTPELVANFMELSFQMESGRALPYFSRFEGPVSVNVTGAVPGSASVELGRVLSRLRNEAGIQIQSGGGNANVITIDFRPRAELRRVAPNAACFVVPNVATLDDYRANRGTARVDWAQVSQRRQAGIFIPSDASQQEVRDCLHEELAQALGPLNDLYRLADSVFNDDNFHSALTPSDMLMLRAYYAPELRSGMSRADVQTRIGGVMARLGGGSGTGSDLSPTPRAWSNLIEGALGGGRSQSARRASAERAIAMAHAQGWRDGRLALAHFANARLLVSSDRARAVEEFNKAAAIYRRLPGGAVQVAHIDMQLGAIALASGQPERAMQFTARATDPLRRAENHAMLATVMLIQAEALDQLGRNAEADRLRVDSESHARYGFGSDAQIRARAREVTALGSRGRFRG